MSKILIIGHSVLDKIYYKDSLVEKPGGVFHSVNTIINIAEKEDEVFLLTQFSEESFKHFKSVYDKVNLKYSEIVNEIPTVSLTLYDYKEREEQYSSAISNIKIDRSIDFSQFDVIYVNMVSGFDILLNDLRYIRGKSKAIIYFDLHTFSRGFDNVGNRIFRTVPNFTEWLKNIDILQMNESEKMTIFNEASESENIQRILDLEVSGVIITNGGEGVRLFSTDSIVKIPAINVKAINFVGCGDGFGASFCYKISNDKSLISALKFANFVAGKITTYNSQNDFIRLREDIERFN